MKNERKDTIKKLGEWQFSVLFGAYMYGFSLTYFLLFSDKSNGVSIIDALITGVLTAVLMPVVSRVLIKWINKPN